MRVASIARAVATGVAATLVLKYGVATPLSALLRGLAVDHPVARLLMASWMPALMAAVVWMASGWAVARFNKNRPTIAVAAYAIFIVVWSLPRTYTVVANAIEDVRFVPTLFAHGTGIVTAVTGVVLGGWFYSY